MPSENNKNLNQLVEQFFQEMQSSEYFSSGLREKLLEALLEEAIARDKKTKKSRGKSEFEKMSEEALLHNSGTVSLINQMRVLGLVTGEHEKIVSRYRQVLAAMEALKRARHMAQKDVYMVLRNIKGKSLSEKECLLEGFIGVNFEDFVRKGNESAKLQMRARAAELKGKTETAKRLMIEAKKRKAEAEKTLAREINLAKNLILTKKFEASAMQRSLARGAREDRSMAEYLLALKVGPEKYREMKQAERKKRRARAIKRK